MRNTTTDAPDSGSTRDFALIDTNGNYIVLEANEWDAKANDYRSVTLYLNVDQAKALAEWMARVAIEAETQMVPLN